MHSDEIEALIRNISSGLEASARAVGIDLASLRPKVQPKFNYSNDLLSENRFDFELRQHFGLDAVWQPVVGTGEKFYVYSAFLDTRGKSKVVRIIAATRSR